MTKLEAADKAFDDHFPIYQAARHAYLVTHTMGDAEYMAIRAEHGRLLAAWAELAQ